MRRMISLLLVVLLIARFAGAAEEWNRPIHPGARAGRRSGISINWLNNSDYAAEAVLNMAEATKD